MNKMTLNDWLDYVTFLKSEVSKADLKEPKTIAQSYNNYSAMQDLENVVTVVLPKYNSEYKTSKIDS